MSLLTVKYFSPPHALWHITSTKTIKSSYFSVNEHPDTDSEDCLGGYAVEQYRHYIISFAIEGTGCLHNRRHPSRHQYPHHEARPSLVRYGKCCSQKLMECMWASRPVVEFSGSSSGSLAESKILCNRFVKLSVFGKLVEMDKFAMPKSASSCLPSCSLQQLIFWAKSR